MEVTKPAKPRGHRRRRVQLAASCGTGDGHPRRAELQDLSEAGCRLRVDAPALDPDRRVVVRPERLEGVSGVVRWNDGKHMGVAFDHALHPAVVDHFAGEGKLAGYPVPSRRGDPAFTDRFGRVLPALGAPRRKP